MAASEFEPIAHIGATAITHSHPRWFYAGLALMALGYAALLALAPYAPALLAKIGYFPLIGVLGAIIANTSGTGGGVVFVPVFNLLREGGIYAITPAQVVAASFLIQCFGMSMGALRWTARVHEHRGAELEDRGTDVRPRDYWTVIGAVAVLSLPTMLLTQRFGQFDQHQVLLAFKSFSILLGSVLIASAWFVNRNVPERTGLARIDLIILILAAIPGGFITALFSVGIGEFVALYLFIRHYPILMATGTACVLSALHVLSGAVWHIEVGHVPWEVVVLAAPGAALGGFLARPIALWLGALRLKTLDGFWIIGSSLFLLFASR